MPKDFFPLHCVFRKAQSLLCLPMSNCAHLTFLPWWEAPCSPSASQGKGLPLVASDYGPDREVLRLEFYCGCVCRLILALEKCRTFSLQLR